MLASCFHQAAIFHLVLLVRQSRKPACVLYWGPTILVAANIADCTKGSLNASSDIVQQNQKSVPLAEP